MIIREMQIKTTMRYHLTTIKMTIMKKLQSISGKEGVEKGSPPTLLVWLRLGAATVKKRKKAP